MKTELKTGVLAVSSFFKISKATLLLDFLVFTSEDLTLSVHQSVRNCSGENVFKFKWRQTDNFFSESSYYIFASTL